MSDHLFTRPGARNVEHELEQARERNRVLVAEREAALAAVVALLDVVLPDQEGPFVVDPAAHNPENLARVAVDHDGEGRMVLSFVDDDTFDPIAADQSTDPFHH